MIDGNTSYIIVLINMYLYFTMTVNIPGPKSLALTLNDGLELIRIENTGR